MAVRSVLATSTRTARSITKHPSKAAGELVSNPSPFGGNGCDCCIRPALSSYSGVAGREKSIPLQTATSRAGGQPADGMDGYGMVISQVARDPGPPRVSV